jgi:hypothetical protein
MVGDALSEFLLEALSDQRPRLEAMVAPVNVKKMGAVLMEAGSPIDRQRTTMQTAVLRNLSDGEKQRLPLATVMHPVLQKRLSVCRGWHRSCVAENHLIPLKDVLR